MKPIWLGVILATMLGVITDVNAEQTLPPPSDIHVNKTINLNQANALQLTNSFKGIGEKRALAIVAYREAHGAFKSVADLEHVRGLGHIFISKHLEQLQKLYVV